MLIAKDQTVTGKTSYSLSVVPGPPQVCCQTYDEAVATARAWASRQPAAVWVTEDEKAFTLVLPSIDDSVAPTA